MKLQTRRTRYSIVQGYAKFDQIIHTKYGKTKIKKGGFIPNSKEGCLFAVVDNKVPEIVALCINKELAKKEIQELQNQK